MPFALEIQLLGDFSLIRDGAQITTIRSPRQQSLLAFFSLHRQAPQPRHKVASLFWPRSTESQALANLRTLLTRLRRTLPEADRLLEVDGQNIHWRPRVPLTLDVAEFESAAADTSRPALEEAVALYKDGLLPRCYDEWIRPERHRLHQIFVGALNRLIRLLESEREYDAARVYAQRLLADDPLRETSIRALMRLHALSDDRASAVRVYHDSAKRLEHELGVPPTAATREAYEQILTAPDKLPKPKHDLPVVDRKHGWARLEAAWQLAESGEPHLVLLTGEAGIGKTHLLQARHSWARRQGICTTIAYGYNGDDQLPYAPIATWLSADIFQEGLASLDEVWLAEAARVLPHLLEARPSLPQLGPVADALEQRNLFEALARATLSIGQPLLLLIDDLHWCDEKTLEWLHYLLRFEPRAPLLIVGTARGEATALNQTFASFITKLHHHSQIRKIELGRLNEADTAALAQAVAGRELDDRYCERLYRETEGNPLFIVETVRAQSRGDARDSDGSTPMPARMRAVIKARLAELSPQARELVEVLATAGERFSYDVIAHASNEDEETLVDTLDELWRHRIIQEQSNGSYKFSHRKIRAVAHDALSSARRRLLRRRVTEAMLQVGAQR